MNVDRSNPRVQEGVRRVVGGVVGGLLVAVLSVVSCPVAQAEGLKVGYLNVGRVFDEYQRTKDSEQILEQKGKQKQAELEGRFTELKKLRQNLELLADQPREAKSKDLEEKSDEFQRLKTDGERTLVRERNDRAKQILDEIGKTVAEYAKTNGFSFVLDQRSILYGQDPYDLTDEMLKILNDRYAAKAAKAGKP